MTKTKFKNGRRYIYVGKPTNRPVDQNLSRMKVFKLSYCYLRPNDDRIDLSIEDIYGIYVFKQSDFISFDIDFEIELKNKILSKTKIKGDINGKSSRRKTKKET